MGGVRGASGETVGALRTCTLNSSNEASASDLLAIDLAVIFASDRRTCWPLIVQLMCHSCPHLAQCLGWHPQTFRRPPRAFHRFIVVIRVLLSSLLVTSTAVAHLVQLTRRPLRP